MDPAAAGVEEDAASVRFVPKDGMAFFGVSLKELGGGYPQGPGQTKSFVRSDPDRLVGAADAADLALEEERAVLLQIKDERGGRPGLVHLSPSVLSGAESYDRPFRLSIRRLDSSRFLPAGQAVRVFASAGVSARI
jgi:hypothetical protein